jgi:hypothetical protein
MSSLARAVAAGDSAFPDSAGLPPRDSAMDGRAIARVTAPSGTLIKKIQPQWKCWLMTPPSAGPSARPSAPIAPEMPIAMVRSRASVNVATRIASAAGMTSAAPSPCTARAAISPPPLPASPEASEESVKIARPVRNTRRLPYTSATRPPTSSSPPSTSR